MLSHPDLVFYVYPEFIEGCGQGESVTLTDLVSCFALTTISLHRPPLGLSATQVSPVLGSILFPHVHHNKTQRSRVRFCMLYVRPGRIELPSHPWQGRVLPLNHDRIYTSLNFTMKKFSKQIRHARTRSLSLPPKADSSIDPHSDCPLRRFHQSSVRVRWIQQSKVIYSSEIDSFVLCAPARTRTQNN